MTGNAQKRLTKSIFGNIWGTTLEQRDQSKVVREYSAPAPGDLRDKIIALEYDGTSVEQQNKERCINCNERKGLCTIFKLIGDPIPLARPRYYSKGGSSRTHVYDAQKKAKMVSYEEIRKQFETHHAPNCILDGVPLRLDVCFTLATPKSQKMPYSKLQGKPHIIRPDTSNMIKYIEDVCSGLLYRDDSLISKIVACKRYGIESYTEFKISVIE